MSWEQILALRRILQLDDIFIVVITHYKQISESEVIPWWTRQQQLMVNVAGVKLETL